MKINNPLDQIRNLKRDEIHLFLFVFVGMLSPGIVSIWFYQPGLIVEAGFLVLVLLSSAITSPAAMLNYYILNKDAENIALEAMPDFVAGVIILAMASFIMLIINLFVILPVKFFVVSVICLNMLILFYVKHEDHLGKKKLPNE